VLAAGENGHQAFDRKGAGTQRKGQSLRYCSTAEVNAVRALQIATHSPIDESDMTIKDAALVSRRWTARSPSVRTGGRLSTE
jgi:hypothetical protein